jgi:hypothetical protein
MKFLEFKRILLKADFTLLISIILYKPLKKINFSILQPCCEMCVCACVVILNNRRHRIMEKPIGEDDFFHLKNPIFAHSR